MLYSLLLEVKVNSGCSVGNTNARRSHVGILPIMLYDGNNKEISIAKRNFK